MKFPPLQGIPALWAVSFTYNILPQRVISRRYKRAEGLTNPSSLCDVERVVTQVEQRDPSIFSLRGPDWKAEASEA
jgi:hypothetical protein